MPLAFTLSKKQMLGLLAYTAVFPVTSLVGGQVAVFGIVVTFPFMPIAWVGGACVASALGSERFYLFGATATVFLQAWLLVLTRVSLRKKSMSRQKPNHSFKRTCLRQAA